MTEVKVAVALVVIAEVELIGRPNSRPSCGIISCSGDSSSGSCCCCGSSSIFSSRPSRHNGRPIGMHGRVNVYSARHNF